MNAQKFVGMNVAEATTLAQNAGLTVRLNVPAPGLLTSSMEMNRITFQLKDGKVVSAVIG